MSITISHPASILIFNMVYPQIGHIEAGRYKKLFFPIFTPVDHVKTFHNDLAGYLARIRSKLTKLGPTGSHFSQ